MSRGQPRSAAGRADSEPAGRGASEPVGELSAARSAAPADSGKAAKAKAIAIRDAALAAAAVLGVLALFADSWLTPYRPHPRRAEMLEAAGLFRSAAEAALAARLAAGVGLDRGADPNGTGLVGLAGSGITTTLGDLAAKRTSAQPDMAALMVGLLDEAGAKRGDLIAVGASGSFPGAALATLAAARALGLDVALVASLGSSSWGANVPGFSYLRIHAAAEPILGFGIIGASVGGEGDSGVGMDALDRAALELAIERSGAVAAGGRDPEDAALRRVELYDAYAGGRRIAAFVNVGGAIANLGGPASLGLAPGVVREFPPNLGGVAGAMAKRGVPIVNVLDIRALAASKGLAWDPAPFPEPGESAVYLAKDQAVYARRLTLLCAAYAAALAALGLSARAAVARLRRGMRRGS